MELGEDSIILRKLPCSKGNRQRRMVDPLQSITMDDVLDASMEAGWRASASPNLGKERPVREATGGFSACHFSTIVKREVWNPTFGAIPALLSSSLLGDFSFLALFSNEMGVCDAYCMHCSCTETIDS
jgi:hypothetical protein